MWHENIVITGFGPNDVKTFYVPDTFKWRIIKEITLTKDCYDEQEIHYFNIKKPILKAGTTLKVKYRWANFYGTFYRCEHENGTYDINSCDCKEGPIHIVDFIGEIPNDYGHSYWDKNDWDPRASGYEEIDMEKYIEKVKEQLKNKTQ